MTNFLLSCSQFLGATTPTTITLYNLKNILKQNGTHFKPKLPPFNVLGNKRYFWEFFSGHCIEWRYRKLRMLAFYRADKKSAPIVELFKNSSALDLYSYFYSLILQQSSSKKHLKKTLYSHHK